MKPLKIEHLNELEKYNKKKTLLLIYKPNSQISENVLKNLIDIDYDENDDYIIGYTSNIEIAKYYNISTAPTILELENNKLKNFYKGYYTTEQIKNIIFSSIPINSSGDNKKSIIIYTTPTCAYCNAAKNYFRSLKIPFKEIDVSRDESAAQEMFNRSGQYGVPQIIIDGHLVIGFNKSKIDELLGIKEK